MKKFLSVLLMVAGLMSCGDDDKPFIPELNKLTSVTCTKNGNAFFNANITYDQDKYNPQNQKSRFQKRKIKKNGKRFVDSLYSLIDLKTI